MKLGDPGFWIDALPCPAARPPLDGDRTADVAIVGAGYTGLWTAYYLKRSNPALEVVVLERDAAGAGASGRNGGWVTGFFSGPPKLYDRRGPGRPGFVALQREMFDTVDEIGRVLRAEGIDADWVKGGNLGVAANGAQEARGREMVQGFHALGFTRDDIRYLERDEAAGRIRVDGLRGATFSPHVARVHPAKLAFGLADVVERMGVRICERTPVSRIEDRVAVTPRGTVSARWVIRATEGYTASLRGCERELVPMNSSMIVTEPLPAQTWAAIGWEGRETVYDTGNAYVYLQRTADDRIAIGGRGVPYRFGSPTTGVGAIAPATVASLRARLAELLPAAGGAAIAHAWSGILGVPRDWGMSVQADPAAGVATAGGYVGQGVAAANLAGRTLRDLVLGEETALTDQAWVGRYAGRWEPEPLRFLAIRGVYRLYRWSDRAEARTGRPSRLAHTVDRLTGRH